MDLRSRLRLIERQLDRDDLVESEFNALNAEANKIQEELNKQIERLAAIREQRLKEEQEERALAEILSLTEEQVDKMYIDACIKYQDVNGMRFEDWYQQSLGYYTIDASFTVHAKARSENTVELIAHVSLAQAKLTILTRIKYKFYDHAVRGYGFAWTSTVSDTKT